VVAINPETVGYRSAFIGAVLRTLPDTMASLRPPQVRLQAPHTGPGPGAPTGHDEAAVTEQLFQAIAGLRRWTRGDQVAVHKPILLLVALDRVRRGLPRLVPFAEIEGDLGRLITEFSAGQSQGHPEYPFWRLQNDGLWEIVDAQRLPARASNDDPPASVLRAYQAQGGLPISYYDLLRREDDVLKQAVAAVLHHFPAELHSSLLTRMGWEDPTRGTGRRQGTGQGFASDQAVNAAVDNHAMEAATAYFSAAGWQVLDVHSYESYDLRCLQGTSEKHVEVKGTTTSGDAVLLTGNEVEHARNYPNVALFVLADIEVTRSPNGQVVASEGRPIIFDPWDIDAGALRAITLRYRLPTNTVDRP
jgi:putative restriction endonuclease